MPRLNKFIFSLETAIQNTRDIILPSNQQLQRSFIDQGFQPVGSYLETFSPVDGSRGHEYSTPDQFASRSHVDSLPCQLERFSSVTNSIPTGIFHSVVILLVTNIRPFEHEFFQTISQSFPLLKILYVLNSEPQKSKQQPKTSITFPRLVYLNVRHAHRDYVQDFLWDQSCHLPCLVDLEISYESLASTTHHFTNDATRLSCNRLTCLRMREHFVPPEHFGRYFPPLEGRFWQNFSEKKVNRTRIGSSRAPWESGRDDSPKVSVPRAFILSLLRKRYFCRGFRWKTYRLQRKQSTSLS